MDFVLEGFMEGVWWMEQEWCLGHPTPRTPHEHLKWELVPIGSVFRGPRSGAEARKNRGMLGPQHSRHWAAKRAVAIADLHPMIV